MTRFDLSATELDVLWRGAGLGPLPLVIDVPSPGATYAERAEIERTVWADLVARELADEPGQPREQLVHRLETIARHEHSLELWIFGADAGRAVLATRGRRNVLGVLTERFVLAAVPDTGRAATLLSVLPDVPAGPGHSVNVDTNALAAAARAETPAKAFDRLRRRGMSTDDARTLLNMATGAVRTAQIVATTPHSRTAPLVIHDTPQGRYRIIRTTTADTDHLTITPVSTASLIQSLPEKTRSSR